MLRTVKPLLKPVDQGERASARQRGYTAAWDREAKAFKAAHPLCLGCAAVGRVSPATVVDHIVPHKGNERLFWDRANWQPCCGWHHDVVKKRLEERYLCGEASAADLRLDSRMAVELTRTSPRRGRGGAYLWGGRGGGPPGAHPEIFRGPAVVIRFSTPVSRFSRGS